jgi:hypothetical protein
VKIRPTIASVVGAAWLLAALAPVAEVAAAGDPWLDRVRSFEPGPTAGFGAAELPRIVLGPPEGLGDRQGSVDVVSLGSGGRIVVSFDDNAVVDGEGDDLVIFENPFYGGSLLFRELAFVEVSADGREWKEFPWSADTLEGLAGSGPVFANSQNGLDPLDPASGGDRFDLADVGLDFVRLVRITDAGSIVPDPGNASFPGTKGGFDLDAAGAIHSVELGCVSGTVFREGTPASGVRVVLKSEGQRRRRRFTKDDGSYRFCRLKPACDYDAKAKPGAGAGNAVGRVYIDQEQRHGTVDLFLP